MLREMNENRIKKVIVRVLGAFLLTFTMMSYFSTTVGATESEIAEHIFVPVVEGMENQGRCIPGAPSGWMTTNPGQRTVNVFLTATATVPFTNLNTGTIVTAVSGTPVTNNRRQIRYANGGTGWIHVNNLTWVNGC